MTVDTPGSKHPTNLVKTSTPIGVNLSESSVNSSPDFGLSKDPCDLLRKLQTMAPRGMKYYLTYSDRRGNEL